LVQEKASAKCLTRVSGLTPFSVRADAVHWATVVRHVHN
jgi:hypothetical protein